METNDNKDSTNFNPHSREGSDDAGFYITYTQGISIHTPAKGVTTKADLEDGMVVISIHTPAKGVT